MGTGVPAQVALIYDWENKWAMDDASGPIRGDKGYLSVCLDHYRALWRRGIPVDVIDMDQPLEGYALVIAPMLYMVRPGVAERITDFVSMGGTFVTTYLSGIVDENDLCFLTGFPGPLRELLGIWAEEIDALMPDDVNPLFLADDNALGLSGAYEARTFCDLIHAEKADVLATYQSDFYAGRPALTVNAYGQGQAYYIASRNGSHFLNDFYDQITANTDIAPAINTPLPASVSVHYRSDGQRDFVFVMNFAADPASVALDHQTYTDMLTGNVMGSHVSLEPWGVKILARPSRA